LVSRIIGGATWLKVMIAHNFSSLSNDCLQLKSVFAGGSGKINDFDGQVNKAFVDPHINIHRSGNSEWNGEDSGEILAPVAINASLFTVLVTDQPIEKLRLKKYVEVFEM